MLPYLDYHRMSSEAGDIDPAFDSLLYVCNRFELNTEQRYWLAWLYGLCYSAPTVYYMYNEFPDFETVDVGRLKRWWEANKHRCLFQTDRLRMKTMNLMVPAFLSYRSMVQGSQEATWQRICGAPLPELAYQSAYKYWSGLKYFGRFTMFNYLQAVQVLTGFPMSPTDLDLANAESCRNGLAFAIDREDLMNHDDKRRLTREQMQYLEVWLDRTSVRAYELSEERHRSLWSVETTLCAYKKYRRGQRWVGYYIDRMGAEILQMSQSVNNGVCWDVLWDFRRETYKPDQLWENKSNKPPRLPR